MSKELRKEAFGKWSAAIDEESCKEFYGKWSDETESAAEEPQKKIKANWSNGVDIQSRLFEVGEDTKITQWFPEEKRTFGRQNDAPNLNTNQQKPNESPNPSPTTNSSSMPPLAQSSSYSSNMNSVNSNGDDSTEAQTPQPFTEIKQPWLTVYNGTALSVKGNFMPLSAQPANVDLGEWLAHHTVENYRLLFNCVAVIIAPNPKQKADDLCTAESCPRMTAGRHSYTWLDNERKPIPVSACQYISLVRRWMEGKIHDPRAFPTDPPAINNAATYASGGLNTPTSENPIAAGPTTIQAPLSTLTGRDWVGKSAGFPETFLHDVRTCFRQIFRVYAHIYHGHFVDPFWHLDCHKDLNSSFVHFVSIAKLYGLLSDKDAEPMQPLIDCWIANKSIPADAARGACASRLVL